MAKYNYYNKRKMLIWKINGECLEVNSWRNAYMSIYEFLFEKYGRDFTTSALSMPYRTKKPFSYNKEDVSGKTLLLENSRLYTERDHCGEGCMWMLSRLKKVTNFDINLVACEKK